MAKNGFNAEGFAKLMASFDTGNPSEPEAMSAARLMRRALVSKGLRLVDVMYRPDVMAVFDARVEPATEESAQLKEAFATITDLADALTYEREITAELREELQTATARGSGPLPRSSDGGPIKGGLINGGLVAAVTIVAVMLMIAAVVQSFQ